MFWLFCWFNELNDILLIVDHLLHFIKHCVHHVLHRIINCCLHSEIDNDIVDIVIIVNHVVWRCWFYRLLVNDFFDRRLACCSRIVIDKLTISDLLTIDSKMMIWINDEKITKSTRNSDMSLISFDYENVVFVSKSTFYAWDNDLRYNCFAFWNNWCNRRIVECRIVVKCERLCSRQKVLICERLSKFFRFNKEVKCSRSKNDNVYNLVEVVRHKSKCYDRNDKQNLNSFERVENNKYSKFETDDKRWELRWQNRITNNSKFTFLTVFTSLITIFNTIEANFLFTHWWEKHVKSNVEYNRLTSWIVVCRD